MMRKIFYSRMLSIMTIMAVVFLLNSCQKEFTITVQSNNEEWGSVTGGGLYTKGTTIQLVALPESGYQFEKWDDGNTDNPRTITVTNNATYTAIFSEPTGPAVFSVSATQKVLFSPGNLQWSATNGGSTTTSHIVVEGTAEGTWRFASKQWETIGIDNDNISYTYTGWIDLFGWGTSGYQKGPWFNGTIKTSYGDGNKDISGTNYDWGVYNAIYNPKTNTTDAPRTWRTLTKDEWVYLLDSRTTTSAIRYAKANVNGVNGLIIVPDNWVKSIYSLKNTNTEDTDYTPNTISETDWTKMENAGCVFLPAAGFRLRSSLQLGGLSGKYWSSTYYDSENAYELTFNTSGMDPAHNNALEGRGTGCSVRLVKDIK